MLKEKISPFIDKIRSIEGVEACALVSRDGIIAGKYFDRELNKPRFGSLLATILASSESIGGIVNMKSLESVSIRTQDISVMIAGAKENFLIAAILKDRDDLVKVHNQVLAAGKTIGEVM
jgi:hypothetical protein